MRATNLRFIINPLCLLGVTLTMSCSSSDATYETTTPPTDAAADRGGGSAETGVPNDDSGAADSGTTAGDATSADGRPQDAGTIPSDPNDGGVGITGRVALTQTVTPTAGGTAVAFTTSASFVTGIGSFVTGIGLGGCAASVNGSCTMFSCPPPGNNSMNDSAGNVTISGGQLVSPITLTPNGTGVYTSVAGPSRAFNPGNNIRFQGVGASGGVGPFDQSVPAPSDVTLTTPVFSTTSPFTVNRSANLTASWTPVASPVGEVTISLAQLSAVEVAVGAICRFPISAGTATISSAILGMIPAGSGSISITAVNLVTVNVSGVTIELNVSQNVATANNKSVSAATFQ